MSRFFSDRGFSRSFRIRTDDGTPKMGENAGMKLLVKSFPPFRTFCPFWICLGFLAFSSILLWNCSEVLASDPIPTIKEGTEKIESYKSRFGRKRPVIAVIGENEYTELTDFLVPYGILKQAEIADVHALSTNPGPIRFFPALVLETGETLSAFDSKYPEGADYVVVPAMHNSENPVVSSWLKSQASKGATLLGICDGVWILAHSGLLQEKAATGHWYSFSDLEKKFPSTKWIRNRRYVIDGKIITTTGVTASIPVSLALVEAVAGKEKALSVASKFGASGWDRNHKSEDFHLGPDSIWTVVKNTLLIWSHKEIPIIVSENADEVGLALVADAYSRTYRSTAISVSENKKQIRTKGGLILHPDKDRKDLDPSETALEYYNSIPANKSLDRALMEIAERFGKTTAAFVALQIEYAWR
ncbi:transcriptional regulator [Leptospira wolffii]|uniref:Transcriptional regulator n=2 Tax=Leptospira wolffii TaxID=409998 RepID=A0A2M9Z9C8_9LEPT|nr:transcriptional regulator [Leptospira wolffii]